MTAQMSDVSPEELHEERSSGAPGRLMFILGVLAPFVGIGLYIAQFARLELSVPTALPILAVLGLAMVTVSLFKHRSWQRWVGLALVTLITLACLQLVYGLPLPEYGGPKAGTPFPAFTAKLADGTEFTQASLTGDKGTVLVFYRGHW